MSEELRDLMVRTAENAPVVRVDDRLWHTARRARRRDRLVVPLAAAAVVLGVLGSAVQVGSLLEAGEVSPAGRHAAGPAMPSRVVAVPEHLDLMTEDTWSYEREPTLAVGRSAVALTTPAGAPVVVSAVDGSYHLLDLPGYDPRVAFRFEDGVLALSPDGRRLAYTWNKASFGGFAEVYVPSGVRIVDLTTGTVSDHQLRAGFGVFSHGFTWSPGGRYLAYNTQIANTSQSGTRGSRNFFVERLDTRTGERVKAAGLPVADSAPAVTDSGAVMAGNGTTLWTWRPEQGASRVDLLRSRQWRGSLVSIGALPGPETVFVSAGFEYGRLFTGRPDVPGSFRRVGGGGQRLSVEGFVHGDTVAALEQSPTGTTLWTADRSGRRSGPEVVLESAGGTQHSFATTLLRKGTRDYPEPDWPLSTEQKVLRVALAVALGAGALAAFAVIFRRRFRRGPTGPSRAR